MKAHIVRQGDYLDRIAHALGFDAESVWSAPENADPARRREPSLLHPGDILFVPDSEPARLRLRGASSNRYLARVPLTTVRLAFRGPDGALANEPCVIEGLGAPRERRTDGEGWLVLDVPVTTRECRVSFPRLHTTYPVLIGHMDPMEEASGVRKRLQHLGYWREAPGSTADPETLDRLALITFQLHHGLPGTGEMDDATSRALSEEHDG